MKNLVVSCVILISFISLGSCVFFQNEPKVKILKVGIPSKWRTLVPSLQHTVYADSMLSNQFEPLVRVGKGGIIIPLAAIEWEVTDQFKTFTFKIDTKRRFSDGQRLSAHDFKRSWEDSLSLVPKSSNNSLLDVLYRIEGYEKHKKTGELSGLIVEGHDTLTVKFKKPFRMALTHLAGNRFSAFLKSGNRYLGTGPYVIKEISDEEAHLSQNEYSSIPPNFEKVIYYLIPYDEAKKSLQSGRVDLFTFAEKADFDSCNRGDKQSKIEACFIGSESRHSVFVVNGMKGRFFENPNHRRALQTLVFKKLSGENLPSYLAFNLAIDFQVYLPLQKGRMADKEVERIILEGEKYIDNLLNATKKQPIRVSSSKSSVWVVEFLKNLGLHLSDDSGALEGRDVIQEYYKTHGPDILSLGMGVASGDPDGIYHALGQSGAIVSPMILRKSVVDLLEVGRGILEIDKISSHYEKVTKAILQEVPFVHLGFLRTKIAYRKDRIKVKKRFKSREDYRLITFAPL